MNILDPQNIAISTRIQPTEDWSLRAENATGKKLLEMKKDFGGYEPDRSFDPRSFLKDKRDFWGLSIVSGSFGNACGHAILRVGNTNNSGFYFHINGWDNYPHIMDDNDFFIYMRSNGKLELARWEVYVPNKEAAAAKLCELLSKKWKFKLVYDNCYTFCEQVFTAGGARTSVELPQSFKCPTDALGYGLQNVGKAYGLH